VNGAVGHERRRRHADLGEFRRERRAMVTTERTFVDGGYRFHPNWRIFGVAEANSAERGGEDRADVDTNRVRANLIYHTALANTFGVEVGATRGESGFFDTATGVRFADDFDEREVSAVLSYGLGAQLRVAGRVGRTEREYDNLRERDFSGTSYRGTVGWLPTTRLRFTFEARREPESTVDASASHVLVRANAFGAAYAATYKLVFTVGLFNERRQYQGDPSAAALGVLRDDTVRTWRFGAGWEPMRHWQLGAGINFGERRSNLLGRDYDYEQYMINVRWTF
jgi:hypothetical protein